MSEESAEGGLSETEGNFPPPGQRQRGALHSAFSWLPLLPKSELPFLSLFAAREDRLFRLPSS